MPNIFCFRSISIYIAQIFCDTLCEDPFYPTVLGPCGWLKIIYCLPKGE